MRLINVRRGQFVYYENKLHKVYSVKPFFKQSVHLIRLSDFEQVLATAREIDLHRPKHLDSFMYNGHRFTLDKNKKAEVGDYILVINPKPDSLDHHHLHAIEIVSSIETHGVISNKANGIKHSEYWVMTPGLLEGARKIDWQDPELRTEEDDAIDQLLEQEMTKPQIGDIYQKNDVEPILQTMIVAIEGDIVFLGGGFKIHMNELTDSDRWTPVIHSVESDINGVSSEQQVDDAK